MLVTWSWLKCAWSNIWSQVFARSQVFSHSMQSIQGGCNVSKSWGRDGIISRGYSTCLLRQASHYWKQPKSPFFNIQIATFGDTNKIKNLIWLTKGREGQAIVYIPIPWSPTVAAEHLMGLLVLVVRDDCQCGNAPGLFSSLFLCCSAYWWWPCPNEDHFLMLQGRMMMTIMGILPVLLFYLIGWMIMPNDWSTTRPRGWKGSRRINGFRQTEPWSPTYWGLNDWVRWNSQFECHG